jgi:predicted pyridoxine 5'-phosphate oxidase superfamily flavin-nucleotide-binding protein
MTRRTQTDVSPFHSGELAIQDAAGVRDRAAQLGPMFRPAMADAYRAFFERLPFVLAGSLDAEGQLWASMLIGAPGFVRSPDPETLVIFAQPHPDDPLASAIREGSALGLLGIELEARRRARVNGHVHEVGTKGFSLHVDQCFGNCPKYITPRKPIAAGEPPERTPALLETHQLSDAALACITQADTCFIASASAANTPEGDRREGVDVSHRGGERGFVQTGGSNAGTQLFMPDYPGNNAFNTLGNLARYPRAGLLFPNFDNGDVLLVTCDTEVLFADRPADQADQADQAARTDAERRFAGAKRLVTFTVRKAAYFRAFMPFRWNR